MKKPLLIGLGIGILLLVTGLWAYLFVYGTSETADEVFGRFGIGNNSSEGENIPPKETDVDGDYLGNTALRQLTTRPVAGAIVVNNALRFIERGTGHLYEIPLPQGVETLISNTTIPQTVEAIFSPTGERVVIVTEEDEQNEMNVATLIYDGEIGNRLEGVSLPRTASNPAWQDSDTLLYLLPTANGAAGYTYSLLERKSTTRFTIPLRDVEVLWGNNDYIYTTPTAHQFGHLYRVGSGTLHYMTDGKEGLVAIPYAGGMVITHTVNDTVVSRGLGDTQYEPPIVLMREKCVADQNASSTLYCAAPSGEITGVFPDDWYKGEVSFADILWKINMEEQSATVLSNFLSESGREIDVSQIGMDKRGIYIYFINKNDGTLWLFDTTI